MDILVALTIYIPSRMLYNHTCKGNSRYQCCKNRVRSCTYMVF